MTAQAVVFDLAGTLTSGTVPLDPAQPWRRYLAVAAPDDDGTALDRLRAAEQCAFLACREEQRSFTFARILDIAKVDYGPEAVAAYRACWDPYTRCVPDAVAVLTELRSRGLLTGLLSNTFWPSAWHHELLARDGLAELFDVTVFSSDLAVVKPHPDAFGAVLTRLGGPAPADCLFVGDRLFEDIGGAQAVGMETVALPDSTVAAEHRIAASVVPTFRITRLSELLEIVGKSTPPST